MPGEESTDAETSQPLPGQDEMANMQQSLPNPMGFNGNMGNFPNMGWSGPGDFNPMQQFMASGMLNPFQNPMGRFLPTPIYE